jgi:hypothetical protein
VVACSASGATFKVVGDGVRESNGSCPAGYSSTGLWPGSSGDFTCVRRIFRSGQCLQGPKTDRGEFAWIYEAVVPCSTKPTKAYPYVVEIVSVLGHRGGACPAKAYREHTSSGTYEKQLCVRLRVNIARR